MVNLFWKECTPTLTVLLLNILPETYTVLSIFKSLSNTLDLGFSQRY